MKVLIAAALAAVAAAQPFPLPPRPDGYLLLNSATAQVKIDAFVDLLCPDCAAAWPTITAIANHYQPEDVSVTLHLFPLPYHTWAFSTAYAGNVISNINASSAAAYAWVDALFAGAQESFWNNANFTQTSSVTALASLANQVCGVSTAAVVAGMNDPNLNMNTRISWKYATTRGVSGTPTFFVNDINVPADSTWTLQQWQALIDPLLPEAKPKATGAGFRLSGFAEAHVAARGTIGRS